MIVKQTAVMLDIMYGCRSPATALAALQAGDQDLKVQLPRYAEMRVRESFDNNAPTGEKKKWKTLTTQLRRRGLSPGVQSIKRRNTMAKTDVSV